MSPFIIEISYHEIGKDKNTNVLHNDNSIEIIQTLSSNGYFLIRDKIHPIEPGAIFIINGIEPHYSNPTNPELYLRNKIIISRDFFNLISNTLNIEERIKKYVFDDGGYAFYFKVSSPTANAIDNLIRECNILHNNKNDIFAESKIIINYAQILIELLSSSNEINPQNVTLLCEQKISTSIVHYINDCINNYKLFSIDDMCKELHVSRSYASHTFKKATNQSIGKYAMNLRLSEIKKLLINTNLPINDISKRYCFANSTVFSKTFKKYTGLTPTQYRDSRKNL